MDGGWARTPSGSTRPTRRSSRSDSRGGEAASVRSPSAATATTRGLFWLRVREHAFYLGLTAPALALCALFFVVPLATVLVRSFQAGPRGLLVEDEVVAEVGAGTLRVARAPLTPAATDRADTGDVKAKGVRSVAVGAVDAASGTVTVAPAPSAEHLLMVAYNDVAREIVLKRL